jgi:hypothetical protein
MRARAACCDIEMAVFARATCKAVDLGDLPEAQSHIDFVDELLSDAGPELVNAVYVSYLEDVFLASQGAHYVSARTMLSPRLRNALAELESIGKASEWGRQVTIAKDVITPSAPHSRYAGRYRRISFPIREG